MRNLLIISVVTVGILFGFGLLMDSAIATNDVTDAGATDNTQTNQSGSNTAITGGYSSSSSTTYQDGSTASTTTNNSTSNNSYTGDSRVVPSASAPAISSMSQDLCTVGISAGGQSFSFGASIGMTKRDMNCERMKLSKLLYDFNMKVAAVSILCQDARVFSSMENAGTPCPFKGKIGDDAKAEWLKYDKQRPDYEEYVASLRYMERVDDQIINKLEGDPDAQVILDGSGNIVDLNN